MNKTALNLGSQSALKHLANRRPKPLLHTIGFWVGLLGIVVGCVTLNVESANAQGNGVDGMKLQGMKLQGMKLQGDGLQNVLTGDVVSSGLAGPALIGTLADGRAVEVLSFAGNSVDVTLWDADTGLPSTATLSTSALVGMTWQAPVCDSSICLDSYYRIAAANIDTSETTMPLYPSNGDTTVYRVEFSLDEQDGTWDTVCDVTEDTNENPTDTGTFTDGQWGTNSVWDSVGYTFSCPAGVIDKCSRGWGYKPWSYLPLDDGSDLSLLSLHLACVRAARADYCGTGTPYTQEGMLIDMSDQYGFNVNEAPVNFTEEARFDEAGAVSLQHLRITTTLVPCQFFFAYRSSFGQ